MPAPRTPSVPSRTTATLVARHLDHDRGGRAVLRDISLTVGPDSCVGVIGPNGVGKSTLLQILSGPWRPTPGRSPSTRPPPRSAT